MRKLFILFALLATTGLFASLRVVDERGGVQVMREDRYDPDGHHYGYTYYAFNRNSYPVYVSVRLSSSENAYNGLLPGSIIVKPEEEASLGWVVQADVSTNANWSLEWKTEPAAKPQLR